jgi:hypothetical protein
LYHRLGFTHVPGGTAFRNASALSYHYYCSTFGNDPFLCHKVVAPDMFGSIARDVKKTGGASMLTETTGCDFGVANSLEECQAVFDEADAAFQSWTSWGAFPQQYGASYNDTQTAAVSRTYVMALSGIEPVMHYNRVTRSFSLCFIILDVSINAAPTVVFVNFALQANATITTTHSLIATVNRTKNIVSTTPAPGISPGDKGCITIL